MLNADRLREILDYDPETGAFRWKVTRGNVPAGTEAGSISKVSGYRQIGIGGRIYYAHRLAFLMMGGSQPELVDHVSGDRADNRWANLRPATKAQNNVNGGVARHNTSGVRGVHWCQATKKWRACLSINNRPKHLGRFATKAEAAKAYEEAAAAQHGEFVRIRDRHPDAEGVPPGA